MEKKAFDLMMARYDALVKKVELLKHKANGKRLNKWLTGQEVCQQLRISQRTLQKLRDRRFLGHTQIGRQFYYCPEAGVDAPVGQADGEFGDRRGGPHPEGEARDRDSVESHRPRQGGGALLFLGGSRFGQVQPDVRVGENEPGDAGRVGRKIGADGFEGQLSRSQAQIHARQGVLVVGGDAFQREAPDDDLFADQRPQGGVEREPSAAKERVRPVGQQGVVHRQPQRKGEADAFDGDLHAERPGGVGDGPSPGQVLNGRNIDQRRDQQQDEENDEQRPERMFENFFQHLWKQRVSESGKFCACVFAAKRQNRRKLQKKR